jgi:hypothetical protein
VAPTLQNIRKEQSRRPSHCSSLVIEDSEDEGGVFDKALEVMDSNTVTKKRKGNHSLEGTDAVLGGPKTARRTSASKVPRQIQRQKKTASTVAGKILLQTSISTFMSKESLPASPAGHRGTDQPMPANTANKQPKELAHMDSRNREDLSPAIDNQDQISCQPLASTEEGNPECISKTAPTEDSPTATPIEEKVATYASDMTIDVPAMHAQVSEPKSRNDDTHPAKNTSLEIRPLPTPKPASRKSRKVATPLADSGADVQIRSASDFIKLFKAGKTPFPKGG